MRYSRLFLVLAATAFSVACSDVDTTIQEPAQEPEYKQWHAAVVMEQVADPNNPTATVWNPKVCTPSDDSLNEVGAGQRLQCDPDSKLRLYTASDKCKYEGFLGSSKTCTVETCVGNSDCIVQKSGTCVVTFESMAGADGDPFGECFYPYAKCKAAEGTVCEASGHTPCYDGSCACSAVAKKSLAQTEVCDGKDNDCDGTKDNGFKVGDKCDGSDSDMCLTGFLTCKADKLATECVNEEKTNVAEACDGLDNDCDGPVDEDFADKGKECDGSDADSCKKGTFVCSADTKGVTCEEVDKNVVETCNGKDETCDGKTDEGCDDDADGYCDLAMAVTAGAACQAGGDCNDADKTVNPGAKELCNDVDDNCNSQKDDGIFKGDACTEGKGVCAKTGNKVCAADGSLACSVQTDMAKAVTEICDNLDNDCDGLTNEGCDDDQDGFCDASMGLGANPPCTAGNDCNDADKAMFPGASETCNGADDSCNGKTDEGCDDDLDKYCDASMNVATGALCTLDKTGGKGSDCNDNSSDVNPAAKDTCNQVDDNCDGKVDVKSDGQPACDLKCPLVKSIVPGDWVEIDTAVLGKSNSITSYWCGSASAPLKVVFAAKEVFLSPQAPSGTKFSAELLSSSGAVLGRLQNSCSPNEGTASVTPVAKQGTCAEFKIKSLSGGVVGVDYIVLDAKVDGKYKVKFTVQ